jgi:ABC-type lipoprotein export system ATPase subunit
MDQPPAALLRIHQVHKTYQQGAVLVEAVRGVDLCLPAGAFAVLYGASGCGKSTLLHLLGGIDRPSRGEIYIQGQALHRLSEAELTRFRRDQIGFVFQFYNLIPAFSALDNVILPLLAQGQSLKAARQRGLELLDRMGLAQRLKHRPNALSGGEQQRVAIARALAPGPALVLADEPTGDLDSATAQGIVQQMLALNRQTGTTFLIATHNPALQAYASHLFEMRDGVLEAKPV